MNDTARRRQIEEVRKWWNIERNDRKWNRAYDDNNVHALHYLRERQAEVLAYVDALNLPKGARVLELGMVPVRPPWNLASAGLRFTAWIFRKSSARVPPGAAWQDARRERFILA